VNTERARDRFMPWGGLALGTLGVALAHQLGGDSTFQKSDLGSPWIVIIGTIVGLALIATGAFASWRVFGAEGEAPARRLIATVSLMAAALFALAILLPFVAAMVIPPCWA
jgi:phosphoglycerol transferase MdoB-like AlkP superfamily enzyme